MVFPHTNSLLSDRGSVNIFVFTKSYIIRQNPIYWQKEHMFYSLGIDTWLRIFSIGGVFVNEKEVYRERIIEMVKKIDNAGTLEYLHTFIKLFLERWGK